MRFRSVSFQLSAVSISLLAILLSTPASAATVSWLGNTDANWATAANWNGTATGNSLSFGANGTSGTTLNNNLASNSTFTGITFSAASSSYTIGGNAIILTGAITNSSNATGVGLVQTLNFNISGNGSVAGSSVAGGQITLAGDNSFTGGVTNNTQGRININSATALGASSSVLTLRNVAAGSFDNTSGALTLTNANAITLQDGGGATFVGTYSLSFGHNVVSGAGNRTLTVNANTLTIGSIAPTVAASTMTKTGAGTLAILDAAGANLTGFTSSGANGTLQIGDDAALGSGTITFTAGALEAINGDRTLANTSALNALTVSGTNNLTLNGKMTGVTGNPHTLTNNIGSGKVLTLADVDIVASGDATARTLTSAGNGATTITGTIANGGSGVNNLTITNTAVTTLSGANTYTGVTTVSAGTLVAGGNAPSGANGAFGNATSEIVLGAAGSNSDAGVLIGGAFDVARIIRIPTNNTTDTGTRVLTLGGNSAANSTFSGNVILGTTNQAGRGVTLTAASGGQATFSGVIQNPSGMDATSYTVTKSGLGTVVLSNTNTYNGTTLVSAGTLVLSGSGSINSSAVTINGGTLRNNSSTAYTGTLTFTGGTVGGTNLNGSLGGLTIGTGRILSPGNSPGTAATTSQTWAGGGTYVWEINNATGIEGANWDLLSGTGTLDISGLASLSQFNINLVGLDAGNVSGAVPNWNGAGSFQWKIATFAGIAGTFSAANFNVDVSGFTNNNSAPGTFGVTNTGNDLFLNYTAVPEPSTWALLAFSLTTVMVLRRRRA